MQKIKLFAILTIAVLLGACVSAPKPIDITKIKANGISQIHLNAENEMQVSLLESSAGSSSGGSAGGLLAH